MALPSKNTENKKCSPLSQNIDKNSSFKKNPGKGGTPLIANIMTTQTVAEVVIIPDALEIKTSFSAPDRRPTERKTKEYSSNSFFQSPPANIGVSVRALKKKTEENRINFLVLLTKSTLNLTNNQARALMKTKCELLEWARKNRGINFWIVSMITSASHFTYIPNLINHWWNGNPPIFKSNKQEIIKVQKWLVSCAL